jgi:hypothetical protein
MDSARGPMHESNPNLASSPVADKQGHVRLTVSIEIAALIEGIHAIVPGVLSPELSVEGLERPVGHIRGSGDALEIPPLRWKDVEHLAERYSHDDSANDVHC